MPPRWTDILVWPLKFLPFPTPINAVSTLLFTFYNSVNVHGRPLETIYHMEMNSQVPICPHLCQPQGLLLAHTPMSPELITGWPEGFTGTIDTLGCPIQDCTAMLRQLVGWSSQIRRLGCNPSHQPKLCPASGGSSCLHAQPWNYNSDKNTFIDFMRGDPEIEKYYFSEYEWKQTVFPSLLSALWIQWIVFPIDDKCNQVSPFPPANSYLLISI